MGVDFRDVIRANVLLFQKLARGYYEAVEVGQAPRSSWVVMFKCKNDRNAKPVAIKLPARAQVIAVAFWSNFKAFAKKPICPYTETPYAWRRR